MAKVTITIDNVPDDKHEMTLKKLQEGGFHNTQISNFHFDYKEFQRNFLSQEFFCQLMGIVTSMDEYKYEKGGKV
jgi:hypothetical protein